ncbi:alpha-L-fucosidase [Lacibacter sp.]|uniref:alpha-L-fucosidase n=1 Tax=Lacibacter sp. TaxID=1915409 RepID=UPI002B4AEFBD|nr:alpha-L-fucosidase [Lacibacter sp.]HLP36316.1 alpha-L-fucosidase [Lacibacter sp.]
MKRRRFIEQMSLTIAAVTFSRDISASNSQKKNLQTSKRLKTSKFSHRLPKSDQNYKRSKNYIEDIPIPEYTWASDEAYENFNDLKYGIRIHWGIYSIWNLNGESWSFLGNRVPDINFAKKAEYNNLYKTWNPVGFNADEWMAFFKDAGMKMFAFTTKHHEGFSMFDTKTTIKKRVNWIAPGGPEIEDCNLAYSIMETPFKRDIVKELCDSARKHDLKIDLYFSHSDFYDADFRPYGYHPLQIPSSEEWCKAKADDEPETEFTRTKARQKAYLTIVPDPTPEEEARMIARHRDQLKELLTNYGTIDMLCLDIWLGPRVWPQVRQTLLELRKIQPNVMFRARGIGNYGDYYTPERFIPGGKENSDTPWFVIDPLASSFSYDAKPQNYKSAKWVVNSLVDAVSKGGNFMVGIGPDEKGKFSPAAIAQLIQAGKWLKNNGSAIYATRAREGELWKEGDNIRFTRSKDNTIIHAICFEWPQNELVITSVEPKTDAFIYLQAKVPQKLSWEYQRGRGLVIKTPDNLKDSIPAEEQLAFTFSIPV